MICPICNLDNKYSNYPNQVCNICYKNTVDKNGKKIRFKNIDVFGGFKSIHENKEDKEHTCYINGIECYADEAEFGGIIIIKK